MAQKIRHGYFFRAGATIMLRMKKRYIVNERKEPVQVILDLATFEKIEEILEDHFLARKMDEVEGEKPLTLDELRKHMARTRKRS